VLFRRRSQAPDRPRRRVRKLRLLTLLAVLGVVSAVAFTFGLVTAIASDIPTLDPGNEGEHVEQNGYIYASDGKTILAVLRGDESRVVVESDRIAPVMKQAIVAVEDRRFWEHRGVDVRGIARAVWADIRSKDVVQGGSTITQQFVKNTYIANERTVSRKLKEAALAWQLERRWSKDRILTAYMNTIYFGNGAYGVEVAARVYFGSHADQLTLPQAALLAGLAANPSAFDPVTNPDAARDRRRTVLRLMLAQNLITPSDFSAADRAELPDPDSIHLPGTRGPAQYFVEYVKQQLVPYYGSGEVFGGGLRVTTSIDLELQQLARKAIEKWLTEKDGPAAALVALDPRDGRVLAMVGGNSFSKSQFNLAVHGKRQSGSAFKPFVLATALAEGISPQTTYVSKPTVINLGDKLWAVGNYEGAYLGEIDLREATVHSDNSVFAQLTAQVGPTHVRTMAHRLGIQSPLDDYFAIGLGVEAVNPLEMARAFGTFANEGTRVDGTLLGNRPRAVLEVVDGDRVDVNAPLQRPVLDGNATALLTSILQGVVEEGTGKRALLPNRPAAGKTGTTDNYGDAWFVGYTPQLAVAVWVGYPTTLKPMLDDFEGGPVAGGTYPALIWKTFVQSALRHLAEPSEAFTTPVPLYAAPQRVVYRDGRWARDNGNCRTATVVYYFEGFAPDQEADCKPNEVDVPHVVGTTVADAQARLASMPLTAKVVERPAEAGERVDVVVDQEPDDGTLSSWDTVRIVVPEAEYGTVPDVRGLRLARARAELAIDDLAAMVRAYADGKKGVVLWQSPAPGRAAVPGMTVRLVVGRG
jgi:penicillin-binding protein 1A